MATTCTTPSPANNAPPSPTPPWSREPFRIGTQTLVDAGNIDITRQITLLDQSIPIADPGYSVTIADGTYKGQAKTIFIPKSAIATSANWMLSGTFSGFTSLKFSPIGTSALLFWDGTGWQITAGSAEPIP